MKKILIVSSLMWVLLLTGCGDQNNQQELQNTVDLQNNEICSNHKWILTNWTEWWNITVCAFDDNSFCFLEDLESWDCEKGIIFFEKDDEIDVIEEIDVNDEIDVDEGVDNLEENKVSENVDVNCDQMEQNTVCWKDWNTYKNKCYLDVAWVEEEVELAHVENWECIFG